MTHDELKELAADCERRAEAGETLKHPGWETNVKSERSSLMIAWQASIFHGSVPWVGISTNRNPPKCSLQTHPPYWTVSIETLVTYCQPVEHQFSSLIAAQLFVETFLLHFTAPLHAPAVYIAPQVSAIEESDAVKNIIYELQAENRRLNMALVEFRQRAGWLPSHEALNP